MTTKRHDAAPLAPANAPALPTHIVLEADWGGHLAGRVLAADADLISALDLERTPYRPASQRERALAGCLQPPAES
jgi:hypothetical protein